MLSDAHEIWLDDTLLPITPASITESTTNLNEIHQLANGDHYTMAKRAGETKIEFDFEIPVKANAVTYEHALKSIDYYKKLLLDYKNNCEPIRLTVIRKNGQPRTDMQVLLEDVSNVEEAENSNAYTFSVSFVEYRPQMNQQKSSLFVSQSVTVH